MTDSLSDDERLRAAEARMRRALGLNNTTSQTQAMPPPATPTASTSHPQRRRFVRDGEVPVTVIHRDQGDASGANALEAARQGLREQVAAREHAEHLLQEAQATIRDLQTKLAHERLARDEAVQRVDGERQTAEQVLQSVREELAAEWDGRQKVEQERDDPIAARQEAEERMRDVLAAPGRPDPSPASPKRTSDPAGGSDKQMQVRRRGRPAKPDQSEAEFVEWWKPNWRDRIR
jgi:hypothetical protein